MSRARILFQVSGSIAAYKSASLLSKLVQSGCEVQVVATPSALKFIGEATLEGLTGRPVLTDMFQSGQLMDHINLVKWADLVVLAPATANTINRLAQGLADDLIGALFLAHDWDKPYLLAPAMNTRMYQHPATQQSLSRLKEWGVKVLGTADGYLACGDEGQGKMMEPENLLEIVERHLPQHDDQPHVLISSGGTREPLDAVRFMGNISSGQTGATLADGLTRAGFRVTFLHGQGSQRPSLLARVIDYENSAELTNAMHSTLRTEHVDAIIHLAAVSDFIPHEMLHESSRTALPAEGKLSSDPDELTVTFKRSSKLIAELKKNSMNPKVRLVGFKLTSDASRKEQVSAVERQFASSDVDIVVANDMSQRPLGIQTHFELFTREASGSQASFDNTGDLANALAERIRPTKGESV